MHIHTSLSDSVFGSWRTVLVDSLNAFIIYVFCVYKVCAILSLVITSTLLYYAVGFDAIFSYNPTFHP